jgi:ketosteroid isomerase-like protein
MERYLNKDKAEFIVDKAIDERRLRPTQKEFALSLAHKDIKAFESFIADIAVVVMPPNNMLVGAKAFKKITSIDDMVKVASQAKI